MKTKSVKIFLSAIIVVSIVSSWAHYSVKPIDNAMWLIGTWENKTSRGSVYESWKKINENELAGKSYAVKGADTIIFEMVQLKQEGENLYYIPTVRNQNNGEPVSFKAYTITDHKMVFGNPEHDFPQSVSYTKVNADSLVAEISGVKNGNVRHQTFPMRRLK
ncbi:hypothetical protein I6H88_01385 [Elizabethkingia bruuniana]|uniref:DUF6265 domain-containing protein n=1 Tax=Elizabethkingia bruuniana TaxID=1756149 RepID=A0A7T7UZV9_9FLAO|nr:DUF6265 family protein [Elizabethkingia bruuniana]KGO09049.1 hypothetical protein KS04_17625 [Elizabethkingia miricola]AQX85603.1 hypothetical protein AYC65_11540 [Elizabethkingia bruuniana]KUY25017.1 hypothetical protein ATB97_07155 [Elizabethkingia bruuniana]OPB68848.1 hypothetical protein BAY12_01540 [Elizabethkingia bruuniana]QDZ62014.1 hypothetical protein EVD20_02700 [Elizabethkingia bruuniana]